MERDISRRSVDKDGEKRVWNRLRQIRKEGIQEGS
jgi:hypothetical protein